MPTSLEDDVTDQGQHHDEQYYGEAKLLLLSQTHVEYVIVFSDARQGLNSAKNVVSYTDEIRS